MDIWAWIYPLQAELSERGEHRLASIVSTLPSAVVAGRHDDVEALAAEGLVLARSIQHHWLEVYLRHWLMQDRILYRNDVSQGLSDVVELFELAHRPEARDCPQSTCVTQDLCVAYAILDGPGYGEERLAASAETLRRIDPSWACFGCISSEHGAALHDLGRLPEAEAFYRQQIAATAKIGRQQVNLQLGLAGVLIGLERYTEAEALLVSLRRDESHSVVFAQRRRLLLCLLLAKQARTAEAHKRLPDPMSLEVSRYLSWARAALAITSRAPDLAPLDIEATIAHFQRDLARGGSIWDQAELAALGAEFALIRGDQAQAERHVQTLRSLVAALRRPQYLRLCLAELPLLSASHPELLALLSPDQDLLHAP